MVALHFWVSPRMRIAKIDESADVVTFTDKTKRRPTNSFDESKFARYYVDNVREALTESGGWYLDRAEGILHYLPMPGETTAGTTVIAPHLPELLRVAGEPGEGKQVQYLTFRGLAFEHAEWYSTKEHVADGQASTAVPGAIYLAHARNCAIRNCEISHVSNYGMEIAAGCDAITIENNVVADLGAGGIRIGHKSNRTRVANNEISNGGISSTMPSACGLARAMRTPSPATTSIASSIPACSSAGFGATHPARRPETSSSSTISITSDRACSATWQASTHSASRQVPASATT